MDLEDLQRQIDKAMHEQNNQGLPDFEGYSPFEMHQILYFTFGPDSPVKLQKLFDSDYRKIPIFNQIKYLTDLIDKSGELKLTNKGYLPTRIVSELYQQGFLKDEYIESGISKLYKETDAMSINLTRILIELAGLTKKQNGKLSLTKSAKIILVDNDSLLRSIFQAFTQKFNWAYYDGFGENQIGQLGYGFSLILLSKYGHEKQKDSFYAEKYFRAYPKLLVPITPIFGTVEEYSSQCYSIRTFERFLDYFGLISIEKEGKGPNSIKYIRKSDLFDRIIKCAHQAV